MQRTGLNRHRRGYVTKERVQRHVPFLVPGPIGLARSQFLNFILSSSSIFPSHNRCHLLKSYITTGTIALSKAVVPIHTSLFGISRILDEQILLMQTRYQSTPIKLKCNSIAIVRLKLNVVTLGL